MLLKEINQSIKPGRFLSPGSEPTLEELDLTESVHISVGYGYIDTGIVMPEYLRYVSRSAETVLRLGDPV